MLMQCAERQKTFSPRLVYNMLSGAGSSLSATVAATTAAQMMDEWAKVSAAVERDEAGRALTLRGRLPFTMQDVSHPYDAAGKFPFLLRGINWRSKQR